MKLSMKKYLKFRKIMALVGSLSIGVYACSDNFLEIGPQNSFNAATLGNEAGVNAALISAYSMLDGWNYDWGVGPWGGQQSNWGFGDVMSDDANKGTESTDGVEWETLEMFTWSPLEGLFNAKFRMDYEAISRANATIRLAQTTPGLSDEVKNNVIAEARFLRGYYYFDLYKMFKNVPYYTEADTEDFKKSNVDGSGNFIDIIDLIKEDFQAAADVLPNTQSQAGRATRGAALSFLGKAQLYNKEYAAAKTSFDAVVASGVYQLQDCYRSLWTYAGENGVGGKRESIFAFQASINDGDADAGNANFPDRLTYAHAGSPFGCCGFRQPTQNLVNAYRVDVNGLPDFDNVLVDELDAADPVDPRLDWVVARIGVPVLDYTTPYTIDWVRSPSYGGEFSNKKIMYGDNDPVSSVSWVSTQLSGINVHLMRYSDVLLMLAEAEVELGNLNTARDLVNQVRARAANCAQGPSGTLWVTDIDAASITWADYEVGQYASFPDAAYARKAVRTERRLELAMEGHRFFDLRRWGIAKQTLDAYAAYEGQFRAQYSKYKGYDETKHNLYPLPQPQIDLSAKEGIPQIKQNPGYE
jgi:hypothetical protein